MNKIKHKLRKYLLQEVVKATESKEHWGSRAAGIIGLTDENKILVLQRSNLVDESGTWTYPGGKVEDGESDKEAAIREFKEETGFSGDFTNLENFEVYKDDEDNGFKYTTYIANIGSEFEIVMNDGESTKGGFYTIDKLPTPLHYGFEAILSKLKKYMSDEN